MQIFTNHVLLKYERHFNRFTKHVEAILSGKIIPISLSIDFIRLCTDPNAHFRKPKVASNYILNGDGFQFSLADF